MKEGQAWVKCCLLWLISSAQKVPRGTTSKESGCKSLWKARWVPTSPRASSSRPAAASGEWSAVGISWSYTALPWEAWKNASWFSASRVILSILFIYFHLPAALEGLLDSSSRLFSHHSGLHWKAARTWDIIFPLLPKTSQSTGQFQWHWTKNPDVTKGTEILLTP